MSTNVEDNFPLWRVPIGGINPMSFTATAVVFPPAFAALLGTALMREVSEP